MIPVMRPLLPRLEEVSPWLRRMDDARTYTNLGPLVRELEALHAARLRVPADQVVSVANATLGLVGAVSLTSVARWVAPNFTFPATGHAILQAGRDLTLHDIDPNTWQLDTAPLESHEELGIMPVLPFGAPLVMSDWDSFSHVVIDAAASLGAEPWELSKLPESWAVVFSLHATKVLPAGEGGLVVFGSSEQARKFRAWSNFGFAGTRLSSLVGTNAKMSESTAAYGLASLMNWESEKAEWISSLGRAKSISRDLGIASPVQRSGGAHPYWIVQFDSDSTRIRVAEFLQTHEVETRQWWPVPLHEMPAFEDASRPLPTPIADHAAATSLGLPMFRGLTPGEIDRIGGLISSALAG